MASAAPDTHDNQATSSEPPSAAAKQRWYDFVQVVITELNDTHLTPQATNGGESTTTQTGTVTSPDNDRFYIEEPYDYIFEPDHYPKSAQNHHQDSGSETTSTLDSMEHMSDKDKETTAEQSPTDMSAIKNENRFTYATVVGENDGFLEYEYKNYTYRRHLYTNKLGHYDDDVDRDSHLLNDYAVDNHLNALVRGVTLSKWPGTGFGFEVAKQAFGPDTIFFVCGIEADSPAEFGLRLGDILVEVDDLSTHEHFGDVADVEAHLSARDSVHLVVVHESKYHFVKANADALKNHETHCEDIVIVSHSR